MADKIGVFGVKSDTATGTYTVYTVPVSKAAKVKIMYSINIPNTSTFLLTVNGIQIMVPSASSGNEWWFSSTDAMYDEAGTPTNKPDGITAALTVAPGPVEYYLSAGDTITYTVGVVALTSGSVQVVGSELDA